MDKENPSQFLTRLLSKRVRVILKWGQYYEGILQEIDKYYNVVLSEAREIDNNNINDIGNMLIRCNNIKIIQEML